MLVATQQTVTSQSGYLDLKKLATYSSCSVRWLRARLTDKHASLPCYKVGGKLLVKVEEFDHWMATYRKAAQRDDLDQLIDEVVATVVAH